MANLVYAQIIPSGNKPIGGNFQPTREGMPTNTQPIQNGTNLQNNQQQDTAEYVQPGVEHHEEVPDSILINSVYKFHYTPLAVKILKLEHIDFEPTGMQYVNKIDGFNGNYYLSKGTIGQNHIAVYPLFNSSLTLKYMPNTFEGYAKTIENINLFQTQKPYTVLSYMGSINKDNMVHVSHTQNIIPRWNISFDYDLICSEGVYSNSGVKNHYLDITTNYYSKDSRYQVQGGVIWQKFFLDENGGLVDKNIFQNNPTSNRAGIPVTNYDAHSNSKYLTFFAHQSYNTVRQVNLIKPIKKQITDSTSVRDTIIGYDTIIPHKPIFLNSGVFGLDLSWNTDKRKYIDSTRWNQLTYNAYWTNDAYPDYKWLNPIKITIGINGAKILTTQLNGDWCWINQFGPYAQAEIIPGYGTLLLYAAHQHYWGKYLLSNENSQNGNGADLHATYQMSIDSIRILSINGTLLEQQPQYIYTLFANQQLPNFQLRKLELNYIGKLLKFDLVANYAKNLPYFTHLNNTSVQWQVNKSDNFWLLQARLQMNLKWNWFNYDMLQLLQYTTNDSAIPVPLWATKNSMYADVKLFHNALRAQIGFDLRYHTQFKADAYSPELGIFYRQDTEDVGNYIWADIFINLQIKRASIYLKIGHINSLIEQHPNYMLLPNYPGNRLGIMYGLTWKFFD